MRQQKTLRTYVAATFLLFALCTCTVRAGQPENELNAAANYDEVVRDLVKNLEKDHTTAQDAAQKLARLGRRSIPVLTEVFATSFVPPPDKEKEKDDPPKSAVAAAKGNHQLAYYSGWALSRIKAADAARPLLPVLKNPQSPSDLKNLAIEALGIELLEEGGDLLQKVAAEDQEFEIRKKALSQLMIMPNFWIKSEKLFVSALSDPDDDIRALAAKQCMYTRVYLTGIDRLIEMAEKEPSNLARTNAMLALSRMKTRKAVPALVRSAANPEVSGPMLQLILRTLNAITGVSLKDAAAVETWWKKFGEQEYAKLEAPPKDAPLPGTINATPNDKKSPDEKKPAP